jgi:hypothetical protein
MRRWRPFTQEDARAIGASFRVRLRDVDELLRQLVDEDGAAYTVFAAPGVYPPCQGRGG